MASKVVVDLLATAKALTEENENAELTDCIEALEFLGEDTDGRTQEYKDLKEVVEKLGGTNDDEDNDEQNDNDKKDKTPLETKSKVKKKLNYAGIKQVGSLWYSSKDKYFKSFSTADECAIHFNTETKKTTKV